MNPLQVPQRGPYGEREKEGGGILFRGIFIILLNKRFLFPFLKGPKKRASLHVPKSGVPVEADTDFLVLLDISFGVPSKGALPPGPPHGVPSERDAPFLELYFIYHSKSPVYKPSLGHKGTPVKRDAHIQSLS